jgi:hypothetical protein
MTTISHVSAARAARSMRSHQPFCVASLNG